MSLVEFANHKFKGADNSGQIVVFCLNFEIVKSVTNLKPSHDGFFLEVF